MSLPVILPKSIFFDSDNTPLPMSLGLSITQLWEDPGVQQIYGLSHQFQLNETAKYGNHEYFNTQYIAWQSIPLSTGHISVLDFLKISISRN